jgi:hypothetical protein
MFQATKRGMREKTTLKFISSGYGGGIMKHNEVCWITGNGEKRKEE